MPARSGVRERGAEHPAGREHDVDPRCLGGSERRSGTRPQDAVLGDQRAVEVARDRSDLAREVGRELGQPDVFSTTYAATLAISCSLNWPSKAGIAPAPFVTRSTASSKSGCESSRLGPTVPDEPAASSV